MVLAYQHNPIVAMREFVDRVSPFDPDPEAAPVVSVDLRLRAETVTFHLTEHTVRALCEALNAYYDPADVGPCDRCGKRRIDHNLRCLDCGHINGVFGQLVLEHAERMRRDEQALEASSSPEPQP